MLKIPDSSFSQGVVKVESPDEMRLKIKEMMKTSDLLIAQEFLPTDFDWRVGILDNKVLFVYKYYMAKNHWQIYNRGSKKKGDVTGAFEVFNIGDVAPYILDTALKATRLIGNGLYGVDVKDVNGKAYMIEIDDNPKIDAGVEDKILQGKL